MQWFIVSRDMHVLCAPSTKAPNSISIYNDKQTISITNNAVVSTYEFTIDQKHPDAKYFLLGNYIAFRDKYGDTKLYTMKEHHGDDLQQTWMCEDIGMDLINATADKWDYSKDPHPIAWYYENLVLKDTGWTLGVNEISNLSRGLSFDGQSDTLLTRAGDIANQFGGAEINFTVEMSGSQVISQNVNIYKKIGSGATKEKFIDQKNLTSLNYNGTIDNLCTSLIGYGGTPESTGDNTSEKPPIDISDLAYDDGQFWTVKGDKHLYDRISHKTWTRFRAYYDSSSKSTDGYINGIFTYDTTDPQELLNRMITELKSRNHPSETYEATLLKLGADIGDYIQIAHNNYNPPIYLSARVQQVENCYTAEGQDIGILGDYTRMQSNIDPRVQQLIDGLANSVKYNYTWIRYAKDDKGTDMTATPTTDTKYVAIVSNKPTGVPSDNPADYAEHWQLIKGSDGKDGIPGATGADGKTSYTHFAYADNVSGTKDFSVDDPTGRSYMGVYSDFTKADSTNPSDYVWSYTKGETGPEGMQGAQGPKGDIGIPGKPGIDGKTPYTHVAYADNDEGGGFSQSPDNKAYMGWYTDYTETDSTDVTKYAWSLIKGADGKDGADGVAGKDGVGVKTTTITYTQSTSGTRPPTTGWTANVPTLIKGQYLWTKTVWTYTDSSAETGYTVSYNAKDGNSGSDGRAGKDGVGIKSTAITYATSTSGTSAPTSGWVSTPPSATAGQFVWTRTVWTYTDNTTETGYSVGKIGEKGATGADGANGAPGKPGADGRTPYFHQAWADSKDGKTNFSATDPTNRGYLGTYTDYTQADSTDPTKYFWVELVGALNLNGRNLAAKNLFAQWGKATIQGDSSSLLLADSTTEPYSGLRINRPIPLKNSTEYIFTFDLEILSGIISHIGGHTGDFKGTNYIKVDGQYWSSKDWAESHEFAPYSGQTHHFEISLVTQDKYSDSTSGFFIQPNRGSTAHQYSCEITNIRINEGNKDAGWQIPPEDTQEQIDTINQGLVDTNSKIAAVPHVSAQAAQPSNPKNGDQWWVLDASGKATGFKVWNGSAWNDSKIQQSLLNVVSLNAVTVTGSTINGSKFTNNFDFTNVEKIRFQGVTTITDGSYKTDFKIATTNQVGHVYLEPDGLKTYLTGNNGNTAQAQTTSLGFDSLSLSNGTKYGYLNAADLVRYGPEEWSNDDGKTKFTVRLELRWGRVWISGVLLLPTAKFGTGGNGYRTMFNIKNTNLRPASTRWVKCSSFGDVPHLGLLEFRPNGDVVAIGIPSQGRYSFEGESYTIESL